MLCNVKNYLYYKSVLGGTIRLLLNEIFEYLQLPIVISISSLFAILITFNSFSHELKLLVVLFCSIVIVYLAYSSSLLIILLLIESLLFIFVLIILKLKFT